MFKKKNKKVEISAPSNFEHRVHTGFDHHEQKYVYHFPVSFCALLMKDIDLVYLALIQLIESRNIMTPTEVTLICYCNCRYVGLPPQWQGIVSNALDKGRPMPLVDPSEITPVDMLDMKVSEGLTCTCLRKWLYQ